MKRLHAACAIDKLRRREAATGSSRSSVCAGERIPCTQGGICNEKASGLHCFVECDGGGVDVVPRARDAMMYLDRISVAACGGDYLNGAGEELTGSARTTACSGWTELTMRRAPE